MIRLRSVDRFTVAHRTPGGVWIPVRDGGDNSRPVRFHSLRLADADAKRRERLARFEGDAGARFKATSLAALGY